MTDNQEEPKLNKLNLEYWQKRWDQNSIPFHEKEVHKDLQKALSQILFKEKCRVFFPLCGKTVDMRHLADMGHEVVGVEYSERAVIDFFAEQALQYKRSLCDADQSYAVFESTKPSIKLYCGDFFGISDKMVGKFDSIWDRGSLIAINPSDRVKYAGIIRSLVLPGSRYFIQAVSYDQSKHSGPPFSLPKTAITGLFGQEFDIMVRDECDSNSSAKKFNLPWWKEIKFTLSLKQV